MPPFSNYQSEPEKDARLSKMTRILETLFTRIGRSIQCDNTNDGKVNHYWLSNFYDLLVGYIQEHGIDDDEDEELIIPPGMLPIMTIHQSKGLEFDFVFVGNLGGSYREGKSHLLEHKLMPFRIKQPLFIHPITEKAMQDEIRLHYVAYSRAKYSLILMAYNTPLRKSSTETLSFGEYGGSWVRQNIRIM